MASVYKRVRPRPGKPDLVTWETRWYGADRRQHRKSFGKKAEAERYRAEIEIRLGDGTYVSPARSRTPFRLFAEQWIGGQVGLKPKTLVGYRSLLGRHVLPRWGEVSLNRIQYEDVRDWVAELSRTVSASTTRQCYFLLTSILDEAVKSRRLTQNLARGVRLPRIEMSRRRYLTHEQVVALAEACGQYETMILTLAYTGIRWGEMAALRVREVAPGVRRLHIAESVTDVGGEMVFGSPKTHQHRWVGVPESIRGGIAELLVGKDPDDLVFTSPRGSTLRVQNFRRDSAFDRAAEALGVPGLVPHELRHTAASLAIQAGANIKDVQQMLGHATATMTLDRYGHLLDESVDRVAERLDAALRATSYCAPEVSPGTVSPIHQGRTPR